MGPLFNPFFYVVALPFLGCATIIAYAFYHYLRYGRLGPRLKVVASLAALPVFVVILQAFMADHIDENPFFSSPSEIIGAYTDDADLRSLTVHADGTFTSRGLPEPTAGTWVHSNLGFILTLTNNTTRSREVRFVRRNRTLGIAPEWEEKDGHTDLFLEKQNL
ncbi:MAG: hypothetical protein V4662_05625 [Verrucomicrobiota bacterium]